MIGLNVALDVGGGFGFSPTTISGLEYDGNPAYVLDASGNAITVDQTAVKTLVDQSGTGDANKNAAQATVASQPKWNKSDAGYNGQPTLSLVKASTQFLASGLWSTPPATQGTIFWVGNADNTASVQVLFCLNDSGTAGEAYQNTSNNLQFYQGSILNDPTAVDMSAKHVFAFDRNTSTNGAIYVDAVTAKATGASGTVSLARIIIGANSLTGAGPLNGKFARCLSYNRVLSTAERTKVMQYLGGLFGITIGS